MQITVTVNIAGIDAFQAKYKSRLPVAVAKAGKFVEATSKALAPVDTGALRSSINSDSEGMTAIVRDGVTYGIYQELGTRKMRAQPFMIPAIEAAAKAFVDFVRSAFA